MKRYKKYGRVIKLSDGTETISGLQFLDFLYDPDTGIITHKINPGEEYRPDLIAWKYLGDPSLFWVICEFNGIMDPLTELPLGKVLFIPTKEIDYYNQVKPFAYQESF